MRDSVDEVAEAWQRERPGMPTESIGIITRVWKIARLLEADRRDTMRRIGLDTGTRDLLSTLRRAGTPYRLTPGELAKRSGVSAAAVSQRVARCEAAGHVIRSRDRADGRSVSITLTDSGHALLDDRIEALLGHEDELISGMTERQRRDLTRLLRVFLNELERRVDAPDTSSPAVTSTDP
ncbi:MAG: MarR family transcriptional regulator [Propionibacteriales bacterium]|nr:MarR family transcriptional regulator [Propionibacteriales bacterium]